MAAFDRDTTAWRSTDPGIALNQWTPEQKAINDAVTPVMTKFANDMQELAGRSGNPTFRDFADLSAQYRLAYVQALPSYTSADQYLAGASIKLAGLINAACGVFGS